MTAKRLMREKAVKALLSLAVLALLGVALQSLVFSDASYTAGSGNPGNVFTAGSLSHSNTHDGQVVLAAAGLLPGGPSRSGTLAITGGGTLGGAYTLSRVGLTDEPVSPALSAALTLRIEDVTAGTTLYSGTPAAFSSIALGTIAPGETRTYRFTLTFPAAGATSGLQGATRALRLRFTGVTP